MNPIMTLFTFLLLTLLINNVKSNDSSDETNGKEEEIFSEENPAGENNDENVPVEGMCSVCYQDEILVLVGNKCQHRFCKSCIDKLKIYKIYKCPFCRQDFESKNPKAIDSTVTPEVDSNMSLRELIISIHNAVTIPIQNNNNISFREIIDLFRNNTDVPIEDDTNFSFGDMLSTLQNVSVIPLGDDNDNLLEGSNSALPLVFGPDSVLVGNSSSTWHDDSDEELFSRENNYYRGSNLYNDFDDDDEDEGNIYNRSDVEFIVRQINEKGYARGVDVTYITQYLNQNDDYIHNQAEFQSIIDRLYATIDTDYASDAHDIVENIMNHENLIPNPSPLSNAIFNDNYDYLKKVVHAIVFYTSQ